MKEEIKLYNGTVTVYFEERDWGGKKIHCYTDENNERIESCTGATGVIDKSGALNYWTSRVNAEKALIDMGIIPTNYFSEIKEENKRQWAELLNNISNIKIDSRKIAQIIISSRGEYKNRKETAADIGTEIHEWIDKWINLKKRPQMPENNFTRNGIIAFLDWIGKSNTEFIMNERIVYSRKYHVIGKLDAVSYDADDEFLSLDDFKSSNGIYEDHILQTAGYLMMIIEEVEYLMSIPFSSIKNLEDKRLVKLYKKYGGFKKRRILRFGKYDGEFEPKEYNDHKKDIQGFLHALPLKNRIGELKKELKR